MKQSGRQLSACYGDKELIEKGFDDGKVMNFYKVYFKEEN